MNIADTADARKPASKKPEKPAQESEKKQKKKEAVATILRRNQQAELQLNSLLSSSMNASFSSEASSSDSSSSHSGRGLRRKQLGMKAENVERAKANSLSNVNVVPLDSKKRCAWITPNTGKVSHHLF